MGEPHLTYRLGPEEAVFCLVWGVHLGDQLEVVGGQIFGTLDGIRASKAIDEGALAAACERGLLELEDLPDGRVSVRCTDRGVYQLHRTGRRVFGAAGWEDLQREATWALKGFDLAGAMAAKGA